MKSIVKISIFIFALLLFGCASESSQKVKNSKEEKDDESIEKKPQLEDGEYCAEILYYNPRTGHRATYDLTVEVTNNTVERIFFCNGGHLDHFDAPELDENFNSSFISDKGIHFDVTVSETPCEPMENCNDVDLAVYEFAYLVKSLNVTEAELKILERELGLSAGDFITLRQFKTVSEYLRILRSKNALNAEVESGYVEDIHMMSARGKLLCQNAIINRYGKYYLLEVKGQDECIRGAVKFDAKDFNWQLVMIKPDPNSNEKYGYQMRIIESSGDFQYLKSLSRRTCTF